MNIKEFVKKHRVVYTLYFYTMSLLINIMRPFVRTNEKMILFVSYGGKHYSDSPKSIFEYMLNDNRYKGYKFVWAFVDPERYAIPGAEVIKIDTPKYYITALKARVWVTNVIIERALRFRGKKTFYLCTSHGIPLKRIKETGVAFKRLYHCLYDVILAQSEYDKKIQQEEFDLPPEKVVMIGYPRNDKFCDNNSEISAKVRTHYAIGNEKKIILYAPTYRDWNNGVEAIIINIEKWREHLSDKFVLLYRAHPTVVLENKIKSDSFFINTTAYEDLDELLIAADILVSDYSSMFFDYSILHRPMICWAYDYERFAQCRDLQVNLLEEVAGGEITEDELISIIETGDYKNIVDKTIAFQEKYVTVYGKASAKAADLIFNRIKQ